MIILRRLADLPSKLDTNFLTIWNLIISELLLNYMHVTIDFASSNSSYHRWVASAVASELIQPTLAARYSWQLCILLSSADFFVQKPAAWWLHTVDQNKSYLNTFVFSKNVSDVAREKAFSLPVYLVNRKWVCLGWLESNIHQIWYFGYLDRVANVSQISDIAALNMVYRSFFLNTDYIW